VLKWLEVWRLKQVGLRRKVESDLVESRIIFYLEHEIRKVIPSCLNLEIFKTHQVLVFARKEHLI